MVSKLSRIYAIIYLLFILSYTIFRLYMGIEKVPFNSMDVITICFYIGIIVIFVVIDYQNRKKIISETKKIFEKEFTPKLKKLIENKISNNGR